MRRVHRTIISAPYRDDIAVSRLETPASSLPPLPLWRRGVARMYCVERCIPVSVGSTRTRRHTRRNGIKTIGQHRTHQPPATVAGYRCRAVVRHRQPCGRAFRARGIRPSSLARRCLISITINGYANHRRAVLKIISDEERGSSVLRNDFSPRSILLLQLASPRYEIIHRFRPVAGSGAS